MSKTIELPIDATGAATATASASHIEISTEEVQGVRFTVILDRAWLVFALHEMERLT